MDRKINKFNNFMNGLAAAAQLLNRAVKHGSFIECVCLTASIIDGLLRMGLILKHQLRTRTKNVLDKLLYQSDEDKIVAERNIYKMAFEKKVISRQLFDRLEELYEKRNKVVHRYLISGITTKEVLDTAMEYNKAVHLVSDAVKILEDQQIKKGIGMTIAGRSISKEEELKLFNNMSSEKHGDEFLNNNLRNI